MSHLFVDGVRGARHEWPGHASLPELLRERVAEHPDDIAAVSGGERLTYRELLEKSEEVARHLRSLGVERDVRVGLFVEPSLDLMVGAWGIICSGGAYLPLSPEYPEERLRYMIEDAATGIVFTQERLRDKLAELSPPGTRIVTLRDVKELSESAQTDPVHAEFSPDATDMAYVIYTSGSTGKPKGVMIEHRSIVNQMQWLRAECGLDREKVVLQKTPMSFDAAQWEILAPACGSRVVVGGPGVYRDPEGLIETVVEHGVTTLQCVPTLLQALMETEEFGRCTSLRQIFSGGEALSRNLALQVLNALPDADLVNLYGPTECTINASAFTVDRESIGEGPGAVPIGSPVHNTRYHILDASLSPVAVGEIGELYVGGVQLARGYLGRPELTAERFVDSPFPGEGRLYRTGDLASWNDDGTVQFAGRVDSQVKLRGFRVELDEIRLAIEAHDWVKNAAVLVKDDPRTGFQNLIACVELSPKEAALMDQGRHGAHHQSKESKLQVRAQLSNAGARDAEDLAGRTAVALPGAEPTPEQRRRVFARKTYRFYEGGEVTRDDLLRLLGREPDGAPSRRPEELELTELGAVLRYFGQYRSAERLLPKYGYASPGSLYATQLYLELSGVAGLPAGHYYYDPSAHRLVLIRELPEGAPRLVAHFMGRKQAIEPVYKNNIQEVLAIETGHMVGLFDEVLPAYGLAVGEPEFVPAVREVLECADEDYYLGTVGIVPSGGPRTEPPLDICVQAHPGKVTDLEPGQYRYSAGGLERISDEVVRRKDVIAINQRVYDRAQFGITVLSRPGRGWLAYVDLGRALQRYQMNDLGLGFMSSGYSSETGNALPAARRIDAVLRARGDGTGPSYFFVGGRVSPAQVRSEGMKEDIVHMQGPAEMIKEDLAGFLPDYMVPNKVVVLDRLPLTANGKIDVKALRSSGRTDLDVGDRPFVPPRTRTERRIGDIWKKLMKRDAVSVRDDFFASGGNSLIAVSLINRVNRTFAASLPLQALFESPTVEQLARRVDGTAGEGDGSRLVRLREEGSRSPVFCWPGLGGYPMNLRLLAGRLDIDRPFYGVQAHGINQGETPYATIAEMAAEDIKAIRRIQPTGPYTLWGYSFGARVAFETAHQLERAGERVANLFLIAPGSPEVRAGDAAVHGDEPSYRNPAFVTILFSVFAGTISGPVLEECLRQATDDESFAAFIGSTFSGLDTELVKRIVRIVRQTYEFTYTFRELAERRIEAPVTLFKARGDDYSFIENSDGFSAQPPTVIGLRADHYGLLRDPDVDELLRAVRRRLDDQNKELTLPHVNIKHFPVALSEERESELVAAVTRAVQSAFGVEEGVVSIALEPVDQDAWNEQVYVPELVGRKELLRKTPNY
ncbi:amino acid adenylation domain-containing protein [Streptomyces sp. I05A-00742]|uniref:amino acid adenylation domain-containing protein n=1 Tax=Streptomyces sp. I05A-00742 TaxID=2732853 RepID=UPI001487A4A1|nr:amino acid adenylation domain-containing protein [Streptomyces sp. I05A-00742]